MDESGLCMIIVACDGRSCAERLLSVIDRSGL